MDQVRNQPIPTMINLNPNIIHDNQLAPVFDRLLGQFLNDTPATNGPQPPPTRVLQRDNALLLHIDLPGFRKEEVKLTVEGNRLSLEAAIPQDDERSFRGGYRGAWRLSQDFDPTRVEARLADGVLELVVPKRDAAVARAIEVR